MWIYIYIVFGILNLNNYIILLYFFVVFDFAIFNIHAKN